MRTKNVFYSLISSFIYQFAMVIINFITIRIFLRVFGSEINGLISSIVQVINYINIVEAGIALAAVQALYKPLLNKDWERVNSILSASFSMFKKSGFVFVVILTAAAFIYPLTIHSTLPHSEISALMFIMAGGSILEYFLHGKLRVLLVADQKSYILNMVQTLATVISAILRIVFMLTGFNILIVQAVYSITILLRVAIVQIYINIKYPNVNFKSVPDNSALSKRWSVLFHQISGLIVFNSPIIIISIFCSLQEASIYAIYNLVFGSIITVINLFTKSVTASFGNLLSQDNSNNLNRVFREYETLFYAFITWLYVMAYILIDGFVFLYTKGVNDANYRDSFLVILFVAVGIANAIRVPTCTLIEAAGHYRETQYRALAEAIICVVASIVLVQFFGIYGVLLGSICSYSYRTTDIIIYTNKRLLKSKIKNTLKSLLVNLLTGLVLVATVRFIVLKPAGSWIRWVGEAVVLGISSSIIIVAANEIFSKGLIKSLCGRISFMVHSKKIKLY